jgi:hypothetical protein
LVSSVFAQFAILPCQVAELLWVEWLVHEFLLHFQPKCYCLA